MNNPRPHHHHQHHHSTLPILSSKTPPLQYFSHDYQAADDYSGVGGAKRTRLKRLPSTSHPTEAEFAEVQEAGTVTAAVSTSLISLIAVGTRSCVTGPSSSRLLDLLTITVGSAEPCCIGPPGVRATHSIPSQLTTFQFQVGKKMHASVVAVSTFSP